MASATTDRRLGLSGNTAVKTPVTVVATTNVTLSGEQTLSGVSLLAVNAAGLPDRVLCTAQTTASENGIWDVNTGSWTRSKDADGNYDLVQGTQVIVTRGTGAQQVWVLTTANPITIGTTSQTWSQSLSSGFLSTLAASSGANLVGYSYSATYSDATLGDAAHKHGRVLQGCDNTGITDCTTVIKTFFDFCIVNGYEAILPAGLYKVSAKISDDSNIASGSLHIRCLGDVTITVDAAATAFSTLLTCYTTAINNVSITGGKLTINGNNKVGNGIYCRHSGGTGGTVVIDNLRVINLKNVNVAAAENQALLIYGRYRNVKLGAIDVDTVDRSGSGTATKGVTLENIDGPAVIESLKVANVLATGFAADADGLYFGGYTASTTYTQRSGSLTVIRGEFTDCQGRSVKCQAQDVTLRDVVINRQLVTQFANCGDIDFQVGGGHIDNLTLIYKKDGVTNRLSSQSAPISIQQQCQDQKNRATVRNVTLRAEMQLNRLVLFTIGASALDGSASIDTVELQAYGAMSGSHFSRCVVEFDAGQVAASSGKTHVSVRNVRGDMSGVPLIGHTNFGASVATKLSWEVTSCINTGTYSSGNLIVGNVSGSVIPAVLSFMCRDNTGFSDLMASGWTFDYQTLPVGCRFQYDIGTATDSNPPSQMAAAGYAFVQVLGSLGATAGYRNVMVNVGNSTVGSTSMLYSQTQSVWGTIN